jgi:hypothetical protein
MSTDMQTYSTEDQKVAIALYAAKNGFQIVKTYADEGRSGLDLKGREGLRRLIDDVQAGEPGFEAILVYDVSRWGRFQDVDESAYYEFLCREAGISIHYCAEEFENNGSITAAVLKAIKRAMAAEYSRELSNHVFLAKCNMTLRGFRHGGRAGFGLRRMVVDEKGSQKGILEEGQQKFVHSDRTVLVPGPAEEVRVVRWMYSQFVDQNRSMPSIARELNACGVMNSIGRPWRKGQVRDILSNEKYIGNNVFNRTSIRLKSKRIRIRPENWVRAANVFEPIIRRELFDRAQNKLSCLSPRASKDQLLNHLCGVWCRYGRLSALIIQRAPTCPSTSTLTKYFGSVLEAFSAVGYRRLSRRPVYISLRKFVADQIVDQVRAIGGSARRIGLRRQTRILINEEVLVTISLAHWCYRTRASKPRWILKNSVRHHSDLVVLVRYDEKRHRLIDYYIVPGVALTNPHQLIMDVNGIEWDSFRTADVTSIANLFHRDELQIDRLNVNGKREPRAMKCPSLTSLTFRRERSRPTLATKLLRAFENHSKRIIECLAKMQSIIKRQRRIEKDLRALLADPLFCRRLFEGNLGRVPKIVLEAVACGERFQGEIAECSSPSSPPGQTVLRLLKRLVPRRQAEIRAVQSSLADFSPSFFKLLVAASRPN